MRPLTCVSQNTAAVIWQIAKYMAVIAIFGLAWNLLSRGGPLPTWVKVGSVVMSVRFVVSDLAHGNITLFICLLVVLSVWLLMRRWPITCGVLVGIAASIKVTPVLYVAYLLYKRQWRALLGVGIAAVLALEVVPLVVLTPRMNHSLLGSWYGP